MELVTTEYAKLQESIEDLGTMISGSLERQREEMQRSHKTKLRKVQIEVDNLRLEKNRLEESIARNERACLLEKERDWYKKEALHLDKVLEQTKAKHRDVMEKFDECEQDRSFLKEQVEKVTKQNWIMTKKLKELGVDLKCLLAEKTEEGNKAKEVGIINPEHGEECDTNDKHTENDFSKEEVHHNAEENYDK